MVDAFFHRGGIVRANFRADAVFQRRDDFAARGVVFRVGAEDQGHVERQADGISLNLNIAFLHDVEQAHLNFSREVRQFVDGENAAIGARQQPVVHGEFAAEFVSAACRLDGIDIADQVGNRDIGRRQFFHVALLGRQVCNRSIVAQFRDLLPAAAANRRVRIVMDFAAGDVGRLRIEQCGQRAQDAALGLAAQSQQDEIMPRKNRVNDLRHDGVVVSDDAGKNRAALAEFHDQVVAHFVFYVPACQALFGKRTVA